MAQGPLVAFISRILGGNVAPLQLDAQGALQASTGGVSRVLNLTTAVVIKATPGRLARLIIIAPGTTSGSWTFNDATTTGGATAANQIFTLAVAAAANVAGAVFRLDFPCTAGIVLSAVPTAGSPVAVVSYN